MYNTWNQTLITLQGNSTALANSTTATSLLATAGAGARFLKPANFFNNIGAKLRVLMGGVISTVVTTPGNLQLFYRIGSIDVWSSGTFNLNTTAQTNAAWWLELDLDLRVMGAAAQFRGIGRFSSRALVGSAAVASGGVGTIVLPDTGSSLGTAFDDTASNYMEPFAQFSVANASNSIRLDSYEVIAPYV
jgi:hypothetical protein